MQTVAVVGLDLAKTVFQVHGVAADGTVVVRRQLRRGQVLAFFQSIGPCLIGIEACASAHHWARELMAIGHEVRLMPPAYVKAYVKRGKTDAADAEAIAEAVTRPTMRFVAVKSKVQQAVLMLHKTRDLLVRQRTMLINALRGHLGEYGLTAPQGPAGVQAALKALREEDQDLPDLARAALGGLAEQLEHLGEEIGRLERRILDWHRQDETSRRLATIPGIGPITASAMAASAPDPSLFRSGRQFAAWLGLTPRANSSGGKDRQGGISKMGDSYLRRLLVVGATAVLRMARQQRREGWVGNLLERKKPKVAAVALANKTARIAWTLMARQEDYKPTAA
ncbi:MAG: IS110 family transposase [Brevundimonas sp.]|uniref:IS110 family transposase n=1 Tax=Brevundimonas sp. TaxID=1871086 RepID=UPI00258DB13F|nr:IS110 family transposase [Brevundimonas sp.]MCV0414593.1 IS110 family transposase [Brevundimonas sp.]